MQVLSNLMSMYNLKNGMEKNNSFGKADTSLRIWKHIVLAVEYISRQMVQMWVAGPQKAIMWNNTNSKQFASFYDLWLNWTHSFECSTL